MVELDMRLVYVLFTSIGATVVSLMAQRTTKVAVDGKGAIACKF